MTHSPKTNTVCQGQAVHAPRTTIEVGHFLHDMPVLFHAVYMLKSYENISHELNL